MNLNIYNIKISSYLNKDITVAKVSNKKVFVPTVSTSDLLAKVAAKFDSIPKKMIKDIASSFLSAIEESIGAQYKVRI